MIKPAIIYSIVVEMLKAKRTGGAIPAGITKLPDHARSVLSDLCAEAVADRRDIRGFRDTAESIFAVLLNCMREITLAESIGISTATKVKLVKADLMLKSDDSWVSVQEVAESAPTDALNPTSSTDIW
jgi:hypothetical protein